MIAVFGSELADFSKLLKRVTITKQECFGATIVMLATIENKPLLLVITGYSKANIGLSVGYVMLCFSPDVIIAIGNCGVISNSQQPLFLGDIAIVSRAVQYDIDFGELGYDFCVIPGIELGAFGCNEQLVALSMDVCNTMHINYVIGAIASGERFIGSNKHKRAISKKVIVSFVDMECGVIGQLAYIFNIPTVFIKGISNFADNDAPADFERHHIRANASSNEVAYQIIKRIISKTNL